MGKSRGHCGRLNEGKKFHIVKESRELFEMWYVTKFCGVFGVGIGDRVGDSRVVLETRD